MVDPLFRNVTETMRQPLLLQDAVSFFAEVKRLASPEIKIGEYIIKRQVRWSVLL